MYFIEYHAYNYKSVANSIANLNELEGTLFDKNYPDLGRLFALSED